MDEIYQLTPPFQQKITVLILGLIAALWIVRLVRHYRVREEHALLWLVGIGAGVFVVWCDPVLVFITATLGVAMPASALLLLSLFFLTVICVWLTTIVSTQKSEIAQLCIELSIMKARMGGTLASKKSQLEPDAASRTEQ